MLCTLKLPDWGVHDQQRKARWYGVHHCWCRSRRWLMQIRRWTPGWQGGQSSFGAGGVIGRQIMTDHIQQQQAAAAQALLVRQGQTCVCVTGWDAPATVHEDTKDVCPEVPISTCMLSH